MHGGESGESCKSSVLERGYVDDPLSFREQTVSELFDRGESPRLGESFR